MKCVRLQNDMHHEPARLPFRVGAFVVAIVYGAVFVNNWDVLGNNFLPTAFWILWLAAMLVTAVKGRLPVDFGTRGGRLQLVVFAFILFMIQDLIREDLESFLTVAVLASSLVYLLMSDARKQSQRMCGAGRNE